MKTIYQFGEDDCRYLEVNSEEFVENTKKFREILIELKDNQDKKEYFTEYAKGYLIRDEKFEEIPIYLKEAYDTFNMREEEISKLRMEYKTIRKLKV